MVDSIVRIDELRLAAPGLSERDAQRLGQEVARRLSLRLPAQPGDVRLDKVELRLSGVDPTNLERLADAIVATILQQL